MEAANLFTANLITAIHQIMVTDPAATVAMEVVRDTDINMKLLAVVLLIRVLIGIEPYLFPASF